MEKEERQKVTEHCGIVGATAWVRCPVCQILQQEQDAPELTAPSWSRSADEEGHCHPSAKAVPGVFNLESECQLGFLTMRQEEDNS